MAQLRLFPTIVSVLALSCPAAADVLHVPDEYATIQGAIDAALPGDTVLIADGVYFGPGNWKLDFKGKAITVTSENGPGQCILDGSTDESGYPRAVQFVTGEGLDSVLSGITIRAFGAEYECDDPVGSGFAIYCQNSSPTITNCVVEECDSWAWCDGLDGPVTLENSGAVFDGCVITDNDSAGEPPRGAVTIRGGNPRFLACELSGNDADFSCEPAVGGVMWVGGGADVHIEDCLFAGNSLSGACMGTARASGGAIGVVSGHVTAVRTTFRQNWLGADVTSGAAISGGPLELHDCVFEKHSAISGGAIYGSGLIIERCVFRQNKTTDPYGNGTRGGAIYGSNLDIRDSLFVANEAVAYYAFQGGGAIAGSGDVVVSGCTFWANDASYGAGGAIAVTDGSLTLTNSILWENTADEGSALLLKDSTGEMSYCTIGGGVYLYGDSQFNEGDGNLESPPEFVDPLGPDQKPGTADDNLQLSLSSPCIDAGNNTFVPPEATLDLAGNPRRVDDLTPDTGVGPPPIVDMGAYEFQVPDCNGNHFHDAIDIDSGASLDCNGDGTPDECQIGADVLLAPDGDPGDGFSHVAIAGARAIVGAEQKNGQAGIAYGFDRVGAEWVPGSALSPDDPHPGDFFGASVAIGGDLAVVGAPRHDAKGSNAGAAYIFRRVGANWVQEARLLAPDGAANDQFGISVAISGDTILVGAWLDNTPQGADCGSAYVFRHVNGAWVFEASFAPSDASSNDWFGRSVALNGNWALVGAPRKGDADGDGDGPGAAYVFKRTGNSWAQHDKLPFPDAQAADGAGRSVAITPARAWVGAPKAEGTGAVYVFKRNDDAWGPEATLLPPDGNPGDTFGRCVAFSSERKAAVVGAPGNDLYGPDAGAAYLFLLAGTEWSSGMRLPTSNLIDEADGFGTDCAIDLQTALVGAPLAQGPSGDHQGKVLAFASGTCPHCYADLDANGTLDLFDFLAFVNLFNQSDPAADCDADQAFTLFDFLCFTNAFNAGC